MSLKNYAKVIYVKDGSIDDRKFSQVRVITLALILFNVFSVDVNPSNYVHYCSKIINFNGDFFISWFCLGMFPVLYRVLKTMVLYPRKFLVPEV